MPPAPIGDTRAVSATIGRDGEIARGEAFLARVGRGTAALVLEGAAGVGKTTVWAALVDEASQRGWTVLVARPAEGEVPLTLTTLADLLDAVAPEVLAGLPEPQRRALSAALLREAPARDALEPRLLGTAVRSAITALAATGPVVLAIDDVQWVDATSATVLAFACRRLAGARVGLLAARRSGEPVPLDIGAVFGPDASETMRVGPLSVASLHHMLAERLGRPLPRSTLVRVHEASGGHPLFALEIMRLLDEDGVPPAGTPLPVPTDVRALVRRRIVRLPGPTRETLLVAAMLGSPSVEAVAEAAGRSVDNDLAAAGAEGIATIRDGRVAFAHPLYAAAIVAESAEAERRAVHARLADRAPDAESRARHRALAAPGPSPETAAELEAAAHEAGARGGQRAAAELLELALGATPPADDEARQRRTIELADALQRAGEPSRAEGLLSAVIERAEAPPIRARARLALARIRYEIDAAGSALALCEAAIPEAAGDPQLGAHAHAMTAIVSWDDFRRREGHLREAIRLLAQVADPDPVVEALVLMERCGNDVSAGRPLDRALVDRALELERRAPAGGVADRFSASLGAWLKSMDDFAGARVWLEHTEQAAIDEGDEGSLPYAVSHLPELELWTGHWVEGEALARRHMALASELGLESQRRQALYNLALLHVHQGREAEARAEIREALAAAATDGDVWTETTVTPLLGMLELGLGNAAAAAEPLRRAGELRDGMGQGTPRRHDVELVEALLAIGDVDAAAAATAAMTERAERFQRHSALAAAARARALLAAARGDLDGASSAIDTALAEHDLAPIPYDRARTLLSAGQIRRRRRERGLAKAAFEASHEVFNALGAELWARRALAELDRTGIRRSSGDELTETERRIAELAATGMTNREAAAALFLSPKTIEANLARIYGKLGISSRAELGALLGGGSERPDRTTVGKPQMR